MQLLNERSQHKIRGGIPQAGINLFNFNGDVIEEEVGDEKTEKDPMGVTDKSN